MAQPTNSDVHVNVPLSNFSAMYIQGEDSFVAAKVFPEVPVDHQSNVYYEYTRADFNRDEMQVLAPGTESAGSGWGLTATSSYYAPVYSLHKDIPDQVRANADAMLSLDLEAAEFLTLKHLIKKERTFASTFFAGSTWTTDWSGVSSNPSAGSTVLQWNDVASTPIEDVRNMKRAIQLASGGYRPNTVTVGRQVFNTLLDHPDVLERIKYSGGSASSPAIVNKQALAALFEVDQFLVMDSVYNSAIEGATESNAFIGGKGCLLTYSPATVSLMSVAAGLTFNWNGMFGAQAGTGTRILNYYMQPIKSNRVEIEAAYAMKKTGADLGGFIATVIA